MILSISVIILFFSKFTNGFLRPLPAYSRVSLARFDSNNFFDDFEDRVIGDDAGNLPSNQLQQLLQQAKQETIRKDAQLAKNWKTGNWKVRGFSLEKYSSADDNEEPTPVYVSKVCASPTPHQVIVGRTDGSVCFVTLGTQYLTQFIGKLSAKQTGNATIAIQQEFVSSEIMMGATNQDETTPFEVERQFVAHDSSIVALAIAEGMNEEELLVTAAQGIGDMRVWQIPEDPDAKVIPLKTLSEAHTDTIVALSTLTTRNGSNLLFTASMDGSMALWDLAQAGDLVYKCTTLDDDQEPSSILCADIDEKRSTIYLGMATGHVVAYNVETMLECAGESAAPIPSCRFLAHEGGVSAVNCAGEGTLMRSNPGASSSILLTGGSDGVVKQWEIMSRKIESAQPNEPSTKLEHWPRLANQRLQRRAHLFPGHEKDMPITAIVSVDASKFLSAGADGTIRAWNPQTGDELFRMDGFTEQLSSLCLQDDLYLITDGMENYVCVHDFDVGANEVEDGYELEW